ncbi:nucleoside hydrolase [Aquibacillus albus]|uniref:Inosine-uridine nucleoside N-ribohydrolase n=1 Tax=Aquibacillus albus TaxID=1168171 RepID=A0ABS2N183_9BACI|nr:nucleoside hydrolase [Aquibacillus albus]MBM7571665.1 inosine-uridine nucleoside N-ribohydrolase [Aquibacillus albus]
MNFPKMKDEATLKKLTPPTSKVRMVLDTDTFNEVDDQFAIVYALQSQDQLDVEAIYAAPFHNSKSSGPEDGMEKSYDEILRILQRINVSSENFVYKGSRGYLQSSEHPYHSEAALDLVNRAMTATEDSPLYVVAIGAITNIASAILIEPKIVGKIVVVWLGGNALHWPDTKEFNLKQDVLSAQVVFNSGVPLVQIPCMGVTSHLHTTLSEVENFVAGKGAIGDFLAKRFKDYHDDHFAYSKVIWDISAIAYLIHNDKAVPTQLVHSPILTDQVTWSFDSSRHFMRYAHHVNRDVIFKDLFMKLAKSQA